MSRIRKMKLVPFFEDVDEKKLIVENILQQSDPNISKRSVLDQTMSSILKSDLDEDSKFKLYKQTLNKLLSLRNFMSHSEISQNQNSNPITPRKINLSSTPNQNLITPMPNLQTSIYSTPSSRSVSKKIKPAKISSGKQRRVKKQAIRRIKEFYQNDDTDSDEPESWKKYNSPKSFRRIKK